MLRLECNGLGDRGLEAIATGLAPSRAIEALYVGCNELSAAAGKALASGVASNASLRTLDVSQNALTGEATTTDALALFRHGGLR